MRATIEAIERELSRDGLVQRWTSWPSRTSTSSLGNFPQGALSHIGLTNAAWAIAQAEAPADA